MYSKNKLYSYLISFIFAFPLLCLALSAWELEADDISTWQFMWDNQIPLLVSNSLKLLILTLALSSFFAFVVSFLLEFTNLKFKALWEKTLLLPLAFPLYVMAYVYLVSFEWASPIMQALRDGGFVTLGSLKIKSVFGVALVFSLALFPYIVIPLRKQLHELSGELFWMALVLKKGRRKAFFSLVFPLLKKPFFIGCSLVGMEVLADFGAVSIFNYDTFTTAIYTSWTSFFSYPIGARLSGILILAAFLIYMTEDSIKKDRLKNYICHRFYDAPVVLNKWQQFVAQAFFVLIIFLAFLFPLFQLISWALQADSSGLLGLMKNSTFFGITTALIATSIALVLAFHTRYSDKQNFFTKFSLIGYGIPGTVIGVAIYIGFVKVIGISTTKTALILALIFGLTYRFLILPFKYINFEAEKISPSIEASSVLLQRSIYSYFRKVWLPLISPSLKFAFIFTMLEVIKEMPLTLILRPVGVDTLATKIYEFTSEGDWERAAAPSLLLVVLSLSMTFLLGKGKAHARG